MSWEIESFDKSDKYNWHAPLDTQEVVSETTAPGDLNVKPSQMKLIPTRFPKTTGIQSGQNNWNFDSTPSAVGWYILGSHIEDD